MTQGKSVDEIVIVDDGSTDSTYALLSNYANKSSKIRLLKNDKNIGFIKNFERALSMCHGDYIFLSDQDDVWYPNKVGQVVAYLERTGNFGVFTDADLINSDGQILGKSLFESFNVSNYYNNRLLYPDILTTLLLSNNFVTGATMAVTKASIPYILPLKSPYNIYHDHYIALKLAAQGKLGILPDRLMSYRVHTNQQTGIRSADCEHLFDVTPLPNNKKEYFNLLLRRRYDSQWLISTKIFSGKEIRKFDLSYAAYLFDVLGKLPVLVGLLGVWSLTFVEMKRLMRMAYTKYQMRHEQDA